MYSCTFEAKVWLFPGNGGWHFVTLPESEASIIRQFQPPKPGFGTIRVTATLSSRTWESSLFPDAKSASYVLPIKKQIRTAAAVRAGDVAQVTITIEPNA